MLFALVNGPHTFEGPLDVAPGHLYVFAATSRFDLEWLVLEVDQEADRVLLVAVDCDPRVGTRDLAVSLSRDRDPLTVRADVAIRASRSSCGRLGHLAGHVPSPIVDAVKAFRRSAGDGGAPMLAREMDEDPRYRLFRTELWRARSMLATALAER